MGNQQINEQRNAVIPQIPKQIGSAARPRSSVMAPISPERKHSRKEVVPSPVKHESKDKKGEISSPHPQVSKIATPIISSQEKKAAPQQEAAKPVNKRVPQRGRTAKVIPKPVSEAKPREKTAEIKGVENPESQTSHGKPGRVVRPRMPEVGAGSNNVDLASAMAKYANPGESLNFPMKGTSQIGTYDPFE